MIFLKLHPSEIWSTHAYLREVDFLVAGPQSHKIVLAMIRKIIRRGRARPIYFAANRACQAFTAWHGIAAEMQIAEGFLKSAGFRRCMAAGSLSIFYARLHQWPKQTYLPHRIHGCRDDHSYICSITLHVSGQLRVLTVFLALWILAFHSIPRISSTRYSFIVHCLSTCTTSSGES
jgi:hypothetical protein